ncbi:late embryogenesis abundant protein 18-like [Populus alba x Populus x berolinensis]|uniref:Late embryogenesis abundant protein 18-like n=1 Tax=Populus alba x Populus x berolinensis TaxID=444605 RepID=A0AAD6R7D7_9ROSI|nr:late embryogenesis abundant protein 18-like [Populus alba x Populus x berolinensis]
MYEGEGCKLLRRKSARYLAGVAKERMTICKAKVEEQATARTEEEKELAKERRKLKGAQAKMGLHHHKHAAGKLSSNHHHKRPAVGTQPVVGARPMVGTRANQPVGTAGTVPGSTVPT